MFHALDLDMVSVRATLSYWYLALVHGCLVISLLAWYRTIRVAHPTIDCAFDHAHQEKRTQMTRNISTCSMQSTGSVTRQGFQQ